MRCDQSVRCERSFHSSFDIHGGGGGVGGGMNVTRPSDVHSMLNDVIGIWLTGCVCLLGVAGNVVSFVVLRRAFGQQSPMFHVLRAMSVSDSVFLLAVFTVQSAVNASQYFGLQHVADNLRGYVQYGVWPLLMTTQVSTTLSSHSMGP